MVFATSPTPLEWNEQGNIGEGDALDPLVDVLAIDCLHYVDQPISMLHSSATPHVMISCTSMMSMMIFMWILLVVMPCCIGFLVTIL